MNAHSNGFPHGKRAAPARRDASVLLDRIEDARRGRHAEPEPTAKRDVIDIESVMAEIARALAKTRN